MELPEATDDARQLVRRMLDKHTLAAIREFSQESVVRIGVSHLSPRLFGLIFTKDIHSDSKDLVIATQSKCKQILFANNIPSIYI